MRTSPSYTASYRIEVDEKTTSIASIVDVVSATGAEIKGLDVADSDRGRIIIDLTCDMRDSEHRREVRDAINALPGVVADSVSDQTFMSHIGGKVQAAGALVGAVMKATRGQADAARVRELIMEMVGA